MSEILWRPSVEFAEHSLMSAFVRECGYSTWEELYKFSTSDIESFWKRWLERSGIVFEGGLDQIYRPSAQGKFYGGTWFPGVRLNFTESILSGLAEIPLTELREGHSPVTYSREDLVERVRKLQSFLRDRGVRKGDVVAGLLSNRADAIFVMLAVASLGAVWSSCSPEFGVQGILDRFQQISPKVLFIQKDYVYNQKTFSLEEKNQEVVDGLRTLEFVCDVDGVEYKNLLESDRSWDLVFERFEFSHPLYILYSSGTTGIPKCIVHSSGGALLQHYKELKLHCDLRPGESFGYYTTTGWMMWNWMLSSLGCGVRLHTYDGAPFVGQHWSLWDWAKTAQLSVFGTSARFIGACRTQGILPFERETVLRLVLSTGSPLLPEDFDYLYSPTFARERIQVSSISGGTDIVSCFMLGNPLLPVRRGEIQSPGLGMAIRALSSDGRSLVEERGELVCIRPFPSMPIYFWNDHNNERFEAAYFREFPGVWHHGDYVTMTRTGGVVVHGRSDATLNPGGVRIGTAEIYRQVETHPDIRDSLVVGKAVEGDEKVLLFVLLKDGVLLDSSLEAELRQRIKVGASPRHVPFKILACPEIPYTLSGKKVEIAVKKILDGEEPKNVEALSNPQSLEFFRKLREILR